MKTTPTILQWKEALVDPQTIQENPSAQIPEFSETILNAIADIMQKNNITEDDMLLLLKEHGSTEEEAIKNSRLIQKIIEARNEANEIEEKKKEDKFTEEAREEIKELGWNPSIDKLFEGLVLSVSRKELIWRHLLFAKAILELLEKGRRDNFDLWEKYIIDNLIKLRIFSTWEAKELAAKKYIEEAEKIKQKYGIKIALDLLEKEIKHNDWELNYLFAEAILKCIDEMKLKPEEYYDKIHSVNIFFSWESRDLVEKKAIELIPGIIKHLDTLTPKNAIKRLEKLLNQWKTPSNQALITYRDFIINKEETKIAIDMYTLDGGDIY